ncbi:protealysin inhibitor emfourin [Arthrobacter sp. GCM10027362]|uniref:protealysin inhibitor emfourin n=1 Tax=Arthrobacter sp. GCM10027362 TaxID=3273379 RepID=UPI0036270FD5
MKLTVRRGGGIAGIVRRTELDDSDLPPDDAKTFAGEVDRAGVRHLTSPAVGRRRPDEQLYEILLEEAGRQFRLNYTDATLPEDIRRLIERVDVRPQRRESLEL